MGKEQLETTHKQYESAVRNLAGSFAAEGILISRETKRNLARISSGQSSYQQVLQELRTKYEKRG